MKKLILLLILLIGGSVYAGVDIRWVSTLKNDLFANGNIYVGTWFAIYDSNWNTYSTWAGGWGVGSTTPTYLPYASGSVFRSSSLYRQSATVVASTGTVDVRNNSSYDQDFAMYAWGTNVGNGIWAHSANRMGIYATSYGGNFWAVYAVANGSGNNALYGHNLDDWKALTAISVAGTGAFIKGSGTALYTEGNIVNANNYVSPWMIGLWDITDPAVFLDIQGSKANNAVINAVNNGTNGKWVLARGKFAGIVWVWNGTGGYGGYFSTFNASGAGLYAEKYYGDPNGIAARFLWNLVITGNLTTTATGTFRELCLGVSCITARPSAPASIWTTTGNFSYYTGNIDIGTNTGTNALTVSGNIMITTGWWLYVSNTLRIGMSGSNGSFQMYTGGNRVEKMWITP